VCARPPAPHSRLCPPSADASKMFNVPFLEGKGLPPPEWLREAAGREQNDQTVRDDVERAIAEVTIHA
jgi:hypothetical protein